MQVGHITGLDEHGDKKCALGMQCTVQSDFYDFDGLHQMEAANLQRAAQANVDQQLSLAPPQGYVPQGNAPPQVSRLDNYGVL